MPRHAIAVDIGGTFTDVVLRRSDGAVWVDKVLTTYHDLLEGFLAGVDAVLCRAGITPAEVDDVLVHATTLITNALIERRGPRTALVTTAGFRDVLAIRDEHRYDMYDPQIEFPEPLVPRELCFGVRERTLADGTVLVPVDADEVRALAGTLAARGVASVAVCLLNAYRNPANEQALAAALQAAAPELYVSLSSDVAPQIREYPRASTTAINAYCEPIARPYLSRLTDVLSARGFPNAPMMMLSNGGLIGVNVAGRFPVRMIESGPAAGALAAAHFAETLGLDALLSFDMGGTTAKACLVTGRNPSVTGLFEVDRRYRFKAGSGLPVTVPSIDMIEIGAGGGSIAAVDAMGLLKVGPRSAGSTPGPACYGRGGTDVCVTDADLAMGLLDAACFLGGEMALDVKATRRHLDGLASALGVPLAEAAAGIFRVVGETMAAAARAHATDRGIDVRGLPVLAFGGAGPLHACMVAELLGSRTVIFPPQASVLSAFGMLVTPVRYDLVVGALGRLETLGGSTVLDAFDRMERDGRAALADAGIDPAGVHVTFGGDLRYLGQQNEVSVVFDADPRVARDAGAIREAFERAYEQQYGLRLPENEVEVVSWRLTCRGPRVARGAVAQSAAAPGQPAGRRTVQLGRQRTAEFAVYARGALGRGQVVEGPALVEERETTTVILPGWRALLHDTGCLVATRD